VPCQPTRYTPHPQEHDVPDPHAAGAPTHVQVMFPTQEAGADVASVMSSGPPQAMKDAGGNL